MEGKRILVNAYFAKNLGDDLFLKVLFDRYPDVKWDLLTTDKTYLKIFNRNKNVNIIRTLKLNLGVRNINLFYKINEKLLNFRKYDAFVTIGGSIFMESKDWEEGLCSRGYLPNKFKNNKKKNFIIGANFGPYKNELFVEKHKEFFLKFDDICFRDKNSYNLFNDLKNVRFAPDAVFNLKVDTKTASEKCIGFSIINLEKRSEFKKNYIMYNKKIIQLVERYLELGYKIKFFSFCEKEGDIDAIKNIIKDINLELLDRLEIINYEGEIDSFLNKYKSCELIIGTRFHSIILALLLNQGVYPIIYSNKTYNVLKDLGMENNCCFIKDMEELDINELISTINTNQLKDRSIISQAALQFEELDSYIKGKK
ncbi:polysaccharide pyruvyl transferase family protein [Neobacillus mesonae]|uniref:polysaccharide pyruvyl transferase family protein n=1 Tax=Neobacillus mesonae TaxID=1193713 RepID=UPI00203C47B6|nr:polysaccharide pyruvyl transferase family protein [Neobacillus mesonae]MCM3568227.1 polysaccharide pyruvyl transferase family protein [Neobacillus mesonae]